MNNIFTRKIDTSGLWPKIESAEQAKKIVKIYVVILSLAFLGYIPLVFIYANTPYPYFVILRAVAVFAVAVLIFVRTFFYQSRIWPRVFIFLSVLGLIDAIDVLSRQNLFGVLGLILSLVALVFSWRLSMAVKKYHKLSEGLIVIEKGLFQTSTSVFEVILNIVSGILGILLFLTIFISVLFLFADSGIRKLPAVFVFAYNPLVFIALFSSLLGTIGAFSRKRWGYVTVLATLAWVIMFLVFGGSSTP